MKPLPCNQCSNFEIRERDCPCTEDCPELLQWLDELEREEAADGRTRGKREREENG